MEVIKYKEYTIEIVQDENPLNPRTEWDNATKMICFHRRYNLGDEHEFKHQDYASWDELEQDIIKKLRPIVIKKLYLYDHSGITISTSTSYPFNDRWDSMTVGFIIFTREQALKEYKVKKLTKKVKEKAESLLDSEVRVYDEYLRGEVYGFRVINEQAEEIDSCYGYYGDPLKSGLVVEARQIAEHDEKNQAVS